MFRIVIEDGKPEQLMFLLCDSPRCQQIMRGMIAPGANKLGATQEFFNALAKQGGWLIQPEGHYCPAHKHAFVEPVQRSLIVPAVAMPSNGMAHLRKVS
jgi:hypothetical protein